MPATETAKGQGSAMRWGPLWGARPADWGSTGAVSARPAGASEDARAARRRSAEARWSPGASSRAGAVGV